ncbi:alpha/beta fold hydrolase [Geodermatophilus sp. SYSU D00815]
MPASTQMPAVTATDPVTGAAPDCRGRREMTALLGGPPETLVTLQQRVPGVARALTAAFDEVLGGPGLGRLPRELATVAALTALGASPEELRVHAAAAHRVGADPDELAALLHHLVPYTGLPRVLQATRALDRLFPVGPSERPVQLTDHRTTVIDRPAQGTPAGPPMVLVHALGLDRRMWRDTIAALPTDGRVIAHDLRGHGSATEAPQVQDLQHFAQDLDDLLDRLAVDTAHLVGLSLGGAIAQVYALTRPERISELTLVATVATPQPAFQRRGAAAQAGGMAGVLAATMTRWFTPEALAVNGWPVRYARDQVLRADPDTWAASWRALAGIDTLRRLPDLRMPTRLIAGELDPSTPPQLMAEIAAHVPGGHLTVIDGGPHMLSLERPRELAGAITR